MKIITILRLVMLLSLGGHTTFAATSTAVFFFSHDLQGSITSISDDKNQLVLQQGWSPWGKRLDTAGQGAMSRFAQGLPMRQGYTGHKQLLDANLILAGDTRLYDPELTRFYNTDDRITGGVRGNNRFVYAYNNPLAYVDPDGHAPVRIYGENNRLPTNEFITAVLEIPKSPGLVGERAQMSTLRDAQLEERARRQEAADPNQPAEDVYVQPKLTLGTPLIPAPLSGRFVSLLAGHTNLVVHAMGVTTLEYLQMLAREGFGDWSEKGRFVGGGFIISNTGAVLLHPWSSFKAYGMVSSEAVQYWERQTSANAEFGLKAGEGTLNTTVLMRGAMGYDGAIPEGYMPAHYWPEYINAISERTQAPIRMEPFESDRFTWYETNNGPRRSAMMKLRRDFSGFFNYMDTRLPEIVEDANRRLGK